MLAATGALSRPQLPPQHSAPADPALQAWEVPMGKACGGMPWSKVIWAASWEYDVTLMYTTSRDM